MEKNQTRLDSTSKKNKINISVSGLDTIPSFKFNYSNNLEISTYFTQEMLKKGFLANTTLTTSFCFNDKIIKKYLYEVNKVFQKINYCIKKILYPWKVKLSILLLKDLLIELIKNSQYLK